jgi:hypothetical protein
MLFCINRHTALNSSFSLSDHILHITHTSASDIDIWLNIGQDFFLQAELVHEEPILARTVP